MHIDSKIRTDNRRENSSLCGNASHIIVNRWFRVLLVSQSQPAAYRLCNRLRHKDLKARLELMKRE